MNKLRSAFILSVAFLTLVHCGEKKIPELEKVNVLLPRSLRSHVASITCTELGGQEPEIYIEKLGRGRFRFKLIFDLKNQIQQDDWRIEVKPAYRPDFYWSPHLTPTDDHIIDQHSFRSPALILSSRKKVLVLIPDLDIMKRGTPVRWYMDLNAINNTLTLGMSDYKVREHVLYVRKPGATYPEGKIEIGFFLFASTDQSDIQNPWRKPLAFLWKNWGKVLFEGGSPLRGDLEPYVRHTYNWAFREWRDSVWQEFDLNGKRVGAPVFIVNVTQSPNYPGEATEREFRSIWNQAWFSSLRSASGLYLYARRTENRELLEKALLTKELALSAPMEQGFFKTVIATEMEKVEIKGRKYSRSKGWRTAYWGNSNRNPVNRPSGEPSKWDPGIAPYHILDMSWTALLMLRWSEELEKDERLLDYAKTYARSLLTLQDEKGFFPAWLDLDTLEPLKILKESPETSMSVTFLLKMAELTGDKKYRKAALKAMEAVCREIIPEGRWEDFETYWSCCKYGKDTLVGEKVKRNNMYKQCNFSMFWTAEALYETYKATGNKKYLELGQRVLDEMLMTQASWQPPYMYVNVLGGFGVMNSDGEWNDSRESLFSELIIKYGKELQLEEYIQRGLAALRASFVMMYCPENPVTKKQWEKKYPFFGPEDYGFTMENYAHVGHTSPEGVGIGSFTIYDWGNGAAA
ncbi:MAG: glycoside hydrolase family 88 protein, partial [bacterium]